jgi:hypothetical protein
MSDFLSLFMSGGAGVPHLVVLDIQELCLNDKTLLPMTFDLVGTA